MERLDTGSLRGVEGDFDDFLFLPAGGLLPERLGGSHGTEPFSFSLVFVLCSVLQFSFGPAFSLLVSPCRLFTGAELGLTNSDTLDRTAVSTLAAVSLPHRRTGITLATSLSDAISGPHLGGENAGEGWAGRHEEVAQRGGAGRRGGVAGPSRHQQLAQSALEPGQHNLPPPLPDLANTTTM